MRDSTITQRRRCIARLERHLGGVELLDATEMQVEAFVDRLAGTDGMAAEIYHVRGFYGWALEFELIDVDPSARLRRPKIARRLPRPIADDDLAVALADPPAHRVKPILYLAAYGALRAQDMCGLRVEDLRWSERQLIVTDGKGGDEGLVDMSAVLMWGLRSSDLPRTGWVFPYADGRPGHLPGYRISQIANRYLHSLDIPATLHQLRHWALTNFYVATRDIRATQAFGRHRSIVSTTIYTAVDRDITLAGVDQLPDLGAA
ncbi:MAG: tyrosine-type recombinase/integrase [Acidimicrobiales bacterium]